MELTDRIIPGRGFTRRGPGGRPEVTDAELVCIAVAQVLLRFDDERHWLQIAPKLIGPLLVLQLIKRQRPLIGVQGAAAPGAGVGRYLLWVQFCGSGPYFVTVTSPPQDPRGQLVTERVHSGV